MSEATMKRSHVKRYALAVSKAKRAGKFTRVGESFYIGVEAELESRIRQLAPLTEGFVPESGTVFTTKTSRAKIVEKFETMAAQIIHGRVMRHPTVGVTLKD